MQTEIIPQYPVSNGGTVTAAISTAATLTLAAPGTGVFIYLHHLEITMFAGAVLTAAATPVLVTSTALPGGPVWSMSASAMAQGTIENRFYDFGWPGIKATTANTAVTIVAPLVTSVIWRINAFYSISQ